MRNSDNTHRLSENSESGEIELTQLLIRVWRGRRLVLAVVVVALFVGGFVAAVMPEEYDATCCVVPQSSQSAGQNRVSSLVALAGINLGYNDDVAALSPLLYEDIVGGVAFRKELLRTEVYSAREGGYMTLREYLIPKSDKSRESALEAAEVGEIDVVTRYDYACLRALEHRVTLTQDDGKGCLTLVVRMPEPLVAAQVAQAAIEQLQRYITEFKIEKVASNLLFVQERYDEARNRFYDVQSRRAQFRDANRNTTRYAAKTALERLDAEYELALNLYNELASQLEQARIKVKETMPVLTVINPVYVPFKRSKPRKMIIIATFALIGAGVGVAVVLLQPVVANVVKQLSNDTYRKCC